MNLYEIEYKDGTVIQVVAQTSIEVIKKYDLCSRENVSTKIRQL